MHPKPRPTKLSRRAFSSLTASVATGVFIGSQHGRHARAARPAPPKYAYIDVHTHLGRLHIDYPALTTDGLLRWMDENHVEKAVVLPAVSPEASMYLSPPSVALAAAKAHPDRLIPFCCIDPRANYGNTTTLRRMLEDFAASGAKGFGEHKVGLPFVHPLMMDVYGACEEVGLPILFHLDQKRGTDRIDLPGVEHALRNFPSAKFIGHGPGFWASISGDVKELRGRPKGKITPGGAIDRLLGKYSNLYCDLSAGSGANAMSRDPAFRDKFLVRHANRILFGTDYLRPEQPIPQLEIYGSIDLPDDVKKKIFRQNAIDLLGLD